MPTPQFLFDTELENLCSRHTGLCEKVGIKPPVGIGQYMRDKSERLAVAFPEMIIVDRRKPFAEIICENLGRASLETLALVLNSKSVLPAIKKLLKEDNERLEQELKKQSQFVKVCSKRTTNESLAGNKLPVKGPSLIRTPSAARSLNHYDSSTLTNNSTRKASSSSSQDEGFESGSSPALFATQPQPSQTLSLITEEEDDEQKTSKQKKRRRWTGMFKRSKEKEKGSKSSLEVKPV